jgi:hypothetical protein
MSIHHETILAALRSISRDILFAVVNLHTVPRLTMLVNVLLETELELLCAIGRQFLHPLE